MVYVPHSTGRYYTIKVWYREDPMDFFIWDGRATNITQAFEEALMAWQPTKARTLFNYQCILVDGARPIPTQFDTIVSRKMRS